MTRLTMLAVTLVSIVMLSALAGVCVRVFVWSSGL